MMRLIRELRRREVFRTLGLYVGLCWILIEASSILLPTFGAPDWVLRALVIAAVAGVPVAALLAWVFDYTGRRLELQSEASPVPALGQRKMDFVVIGVLTVALMFSVYLNVSGPSGQRIAAELDPVSVLIADFDNRTGDAVFDGLIEQALSIGVEQAPHVAFYNRLEARDLASRLQPNATGLRLDRARLVAVREGVDLVMSGAIEPDGGGFRLELRGVEPINGDLSFDVSVRADSRESVLEAVGALASAAREALGDQSSATSPSATAEAFTTASIEAARAYVDGIELAYDGRHEEAIARFRIATEIDGTFGRAFAAWAVSEFKLGRLDEAEAQWGRSLSLIGTMTERERLRTLGSYYVVATRNYPEAIETFSELVAKYPADAAGHNNLAVAFFQSLDFARAAYEGGRVLETFPASRLYRSNFALYAMYSGQFEVAAAEARALVRDDPSYGVGYLPLAIAALARGDIDGAREAYAGMSAATASELRQGAAALGLADLEIYVGELDEARARLLDGIQSDLSAGALLAAATKQIAFAETFAQTGEDGTAIEAANRALELSHASSIKVAAAIVFLESGDTGSASRLADELAADINSHNRAYAGMIRARLVSASGNAAEVIGALRQALDVADLWRIRYELGRAYLEAGYFAEAFDELRGCEERQGEGSALFLDDAPTFRYLADLPYWLARAQDGLGMREDAVRNYEAFLMRRSQGALAADARARLE